MRWCLRDPETLMKAISLIQNIKHIHNKIINNKYHRSVSGPSLVWRLFPRPGEMAREVCPPLGAKEEGEEGETRREASEEDDLDRMHLLDLWKMPPPPEGAGGGDCGILGRTLHLGLVEPPVLELEAVVPVHEAVPDDDLELNELRDHS